MKHFGNKPQSIAPRQVRASEHVGLSDKVAVQISIVTPVSTGSTELETLVASMSVGQWALLSTNNINVVLGQGAASGNILSYALSSCWDPVGKRIYFQGQDHAQNPVTGLIFAQYDDATNTWSQAGSIPNTSTHAYDHMAIDQVNRKLYLYMGFNTLDIREYPIATNGPWAAPFVVPDGGYLQVSIGLEYWPGVGLIWYNGGEPNGDVWIRAENTLAWTQIYGFGNGVDTSGAHTFCEYSPGANCCIIGGGHQDPGQNYIFRINPDKTITAMADAPIGVAILKGNIVADPVTGNFIVWGSDQLWEFNPRSYGLWRQLSNTPPAGVNDPDDQKSLFTTSVSTYNVMAYVSGFAGTANVYIYKHASAVDSTGTDFATKRVAAGVLGSWGFDDPADLKYTWDNSNAVLDAHMTGLGYSRYSITLNRNAGEGNTAAGEQPTGVISRPEIDTTIKHGSGGSLKFTIPSQSLQGVGFFQANYNDTLGNPSLYIAPGSPNGAVVYAQWRLRINDAMLNTLFREYREAWFNTLTTSGANSTTLARGSGSVFTSDMAGLMIALDRTTNIVAGIYTIVSFTDSSHVVLDRTPSPSGAGSGGNGYLQGTTTAGGWKTAIQFGNSPNGSSSSTVEITMNNRNCYGNPTMYGQQGLDGPPTNNVAVHFIADKWMEITTRIEVLGVGNAASSRVQWWVDGVAAGDWTTAKIDWGNLNGDGLGQIMMTPFHTRKDPTQVHDTGYMWVDDLIVSTQSIAMSS